MNSRVCCFAGLVLFTLAACAPEGPAIEDDIFESMPPEEDVVLPPSGNAGPQERIPELEQCDADDYRLLIGTPISAVTLPQDDLIRAYGENDIITQDYLPQRTNIVYSMDGIIQRVECG